MKILMLGGTGVIGCALIEQLKNTNNIVYVTSRFERKQVYKNIMYIVGNANDYDFINSFEDNSFDCLIDFMNYRDEILSRNIDKLSKIAKQYFFISSARVYASSNSDLSEKSNLLKDTSNDIDFINSGTYAIKKAKQEEFIKSRINNYVIIRPYKTYFYDRLQLGYYEIKHWLDRLLDNKPIIINSKILDKKTTLTSGFDVSYGIYKLIGNDIARNEVYQIATNQYMCWKDVMNIYIDVLLQNGIKPLIYLNDDTSPIDIFFEKGYQFKYDILFNRTFNSYKINEAINEVIKYTDMKFGLSKAVQEYIDIYCHNHDYENDFDKTVDELLLKNDYIEYEVK